MAARKKIGILTSFTSEVFRGEYFMRIITGIVNAMQGTAYDLKFIMVRDGETPDRKVFEEEKIEGLLFLTWTIHGRYLSEAKAAGIPVVVINDYSSGLDANIVYSDNRSGVEQCLQYLVKTGRTRVGMLQAPDDASVDSRERLRLWKELIPSYGLTADSDHFKKCEYYFEEDGFLKMMDILKCGKVLPQAVLCFNDDIAIGALRALRECWIMCPGQVSVIGYDGIARGKFVEPALTTINQPLEKMGSEMVRILIEILEGRAKQPVQKKFMPELVIRRSS
jgi:DNA-binding LacI/PurR family transcriptional regulator